MSVGGGQGWCGNDRWGLEHDVQSSETDTDHPRGFILDSIGIIIFLSRNFFKDSTVHPGNDKQTAWTRGRDERKEGGGGAEGVEEFSCDGVEGEGTSF